MSSEKKPGKPSGRVSQTVIEKTDKQGGRRKRTITDEDIPAGESAVPPSDPSGLDNPDNAMFSESSDVRDYAGYDRTLRDYMATAEGVNTFSANLYKYDNIIKQKQHFCATTQNEMLSMHDVGVAYGGGAYRYLVTFPLDSKLPPKAFTFNIHPSYDIVRDRAGNGQASAVAMPQQSAVGNLQDTVALLKSVVDVLRPILQPAQSNPMESTLGAYAMVSDVLKRNLMETTTLYREMARGQQSQPPSNEEEEEQPRGPGVMETVLALVDKFAPLLLGNGPAAQAVATAVKAAPQFKEVLGNPGELKALISAVEKKMGKKDTEEILKAVGVKRP